MPSQYLLEFIYLLIAAVIMVPICQAIKLGAVPGFLLAGLAIGPFGLGLIAQVEDVSHISEFGVVLLLFLIGMEMKPAFLWKIRRLVFGQGSLQLVLTGTVITSICYYGFNLDFAASIIIGPALALSSTAFVLQLLNEQKSLSSEYGRSSMAVLLFQDLAVVPLLAMIPLLSADQSSDIHLGYAFLKSIGILALVILAGRYLLNPILYRVAHAANSEVFTASALLIVLGTAYLTEHAGLSMAMGAFLAGLLISDSAFRHQIRAEVQPFRGLLLGLFFMSMGMSLNLDVLSQSPLFIIAMVFALVAIKALILWPISRLFGLNKHNGLAVALILAQGGEFALVLFSIAFNSHILTQSTFDTLLLIVLISMLVTPILAAIAYKLHLKPSDKPLEQKEIEFQPIVIAGFGRVGRRVGDILSLAGVPYVALESEVSLVKKYQALGMPVFYADVTKPETLHSAGIANAESIIVTVNDSEVATTLVEILSQHYPSIKIYARGHNAPICKKLMDLGAYKVVSENLEASIELSRQLLLSSGFTFEQQDELLTDYKQDYYEQVHPDNAKVKK
ncbi:monovalent cation:proton antiporter-2 (CPA2) family protein [Psychrosphaera sp. B3R10]|nr:monovalent cation:proton antiporter-2 (CPA2) family protein [Psychrosphaera sp. I2R16]MBU2988813.1 monovalent cation:proton antiporter-2 (CPA2) family protein [Psychrosphaera sp. B3R10]